MAVETEPQYNYEEQALPGMSRRMMLEREKPSTLVALREEMLNKLSSLERDIHLINDVLDGYGTQDGPWERGEN